MNTLEQWRCLAAVIDEGGFAAAAERLCKSQSTLSHAVQQLQRSLGVRLLTRAGRRAVLTPAGATLLRHARQMLAQADAVDRLATTLAEGREPHLTLAVDGAFPRDTLFTALAAFGSESPETRVDILETVLSGSAEALLEGRGDLVITPQVPPGFLGELLLRLDFVAVAHPDHPLHQQAQALMQDDLRRHQQIVVRDSGLRMRTDAGWLGAERRLTVSHPATAIEALCRGLGFAWMPRIAIRSELESRTLATLPLITGGIRWMDLYLVLAGAHTPGATISLLAGHLRRGCEALMPTQAPGEGRTST